VSADLRLVKDKVESYLRDLVGTFEIDTDGDYTFRLGSARAFIRVAPKGDDNSLVVIRSFTNFRIPPSPEVFHYVATHNDWVFGSLAAHETDEGVNISFSHTLLGDYLDPEEFNFAVVAVASTGDEIDNEIKDKFGGTVFHED
jgi:hypothetical protein